MPLSASPPGFNFDLDCKPRMSCPLHPETRDKEGAQEILNDVDSLGLMTLLSEAVPGLPDLQLRMSSL